MVVVVEGAVHFVVVVVTGSVVVVAGAEGCGDGADEVGTDVVTEGAPGAAEGPMSDAVGEVGDVIVDAAVRTFVVVEELTPFCAGCVAAAVLEVSGDGGGSGTGGGMVGVVACVLCPSPFGSGIVPTASWRTTNDAGSSRYATSAMANATASSTTTRETRSRRARRSPGYRRATRT